MSDQGIHWAEKYVGIPYVEGEMDCASFTVKVQREQFGREISLPTHRAHGVRGQSRQILSHQDSYATRVKTPVDGDAVLMFGRGRICHIGTFINHHGQLMVLHAMQSAGQVCLHRIYDLNRYGLDAEGYYRWL